MQPGDLADELFLVSRLREVPPELPMESKLVTVIRIGRGAGDSFVIEQAKSVAEKRAMFNELSSGDLVLAVWTGKWSSDAFLIPFPFKELVV